MMEFTLTRAVTLAGTPNGSRPCDCLRALRRILCVREELARPGRPGFVRSCRPQPVSLTSRARRETPSKLAYADTLELRCAEGGKEFETGLTNPDAEHSTTAYPPRRVRLATS